MHGLRVLVLFPFCVYGLYVGNNGSSSSNNGLFYFNGNNTPDGNNNGSRLINPEGAYKNESVPSAEKNHIAVINTIYALAMHSSHSVKISAMENRASRFSLECSVRTKR